MPEVGKIDLKWEDLTPGKVIASMTYMLTPDDIREEADTWHVTATVLVNRSSQKGIVIGPKGRVLRYVKRLVEPEISAMFGVTAHVELWVKVEKNWTANFWLLQQMGYAGTR